TFRLEIPPQLNANSHPFYVDSPPLPGGDCCRELPPSGNRQLQYNASPPVLSSVIRLARARPRITGVPHFCGTLKTTSVEPVLPAASVTRSTTTWAPGLSGSVLNSKVFDLPSKRPSTGKTLTHLRLSTE